MIVSSRSWHIARTASSSLLLNEDDDDGHFLSFVLMCEDIVECELARTAHNFGVVISWHGVKNLFLDALASLDFTLVSKSVSH